MEEVENFLIDFMGFRRMLENDDGVKRTKKERERTTKSIQEFLEQFKNGTYYKLHNTFYGGIIHKEQDSPIPWSEAVSYTHLDVYKRQAISIFPYHLGRKSAFLVVPAHRNRRSYSSYRAFTMW